ncbi:hypothetical protein ACH5RR_031342 [Cinchona calisaya]|uniref:Retrotransposon gag domain-containing protein n=1 Tax=Cinchona calisaya TaxID=153742 RepID=A0ABD2YJ88_9GENT
MAGGTVDRVQRLEVVVNQLMEQLGDLPEGYVLRSSLDETRDAVEAVRDHFQQVEQSFNARFVALERIQEDMAVLKKAVAGVELGGSTGHSSMARMKVPDPKHFDGARSAKELENFLWDMEQYFKAAAVPEEEKVSITSMYLAGDAKLWWRTRVSDDTVPQISTWVGLKTELKRQFLPTNTSWIAREALRRLKHTGGVREYVKDFSSLLLDIRGMSEDDKLFNFMAGLQQWAQTELQRQGVQNLQQAITAADRLVDFQTIRTNDSGQGVNNVNKEPTNGNARQKMKKKAVVTETVSGKAPFNYEKSKFGGCFICKGPHLARQCPKREQLSAVQADEDGPSCARMGSLQLVCDANEPQLS